VECVTDPDCRTDQICYNNRCVNPCLIQNPCATNAICTASNHAAQCKCPPGLIGNPLEQCLTVECNINPDCPSNKACIRNHCMDPCLFDNVCAPTALCTTINHVASCACPPGLVGNPLVSCSAQKEPLPVESEPECTIDSDCPSGKPTYLSHYFALHQSMLFTLKVELVWKNHVETLALNLIHVHHQQFALLWTQSLSEP